MRISIWHESQCSGGYRPGVFAAQLAAAQQYCLTTAGYAPLHEWAKRHTWQMHSPPGEHDLIITPGNNQTIEVRASVARIEEARACDQAGGKIQLHACRHRCCSMCLSHMN